MSGIELPLTADLRQRLREAVSEARRRKVGCELDGRPTAEDLRLWRRFVRMSRVEAARRLGVAIHVIESLETVGVPLNRRHPPRDTELVDRYVKILRQASCTIESRPTRNRPTFTESDRRLEREIMARRGGREYVEIDC